MNDIEARDIELLTIAKERKIFAVMIRKQVENQAVNSYLVEYMRKLTKDLADWYKYEGKEREHFFELTGIKEKPY